MAAPASSAAVHVADDVIRVPLHVNVQATFGTNARLFCLDTEEAVEVGDDGRPTAALVPTHSYRLERRYASLYPGITPAASATPELPPFFPIGVLETCFRQKNGTPRQGCVCPSSLARLRLTYGSNPQHMGRGLDTFSHVWVLFVFHQNTNKTLDALGVPKVCATVRPPRLNGAKTGVLSTRSPHRPSPIGLSLCKLESVDGPVIMLSGVDIVDGSPVLDIKPYVPSYDHPPSDQPVRVPEWVVNAPVRQVQVVFSPEADAALDDLVPLTRFFTSKEVLRQGIVEVLREDPRSVYRRQQCADEEYGMGFDDVDVTCRFESEERCEPGVESGGRVVVVAVAHRSVRMGRMMMTAEVEE